jgi:signal transduction histidine kinase
MGGYISIMTPMSANAELHTIANQARNLLRCAAASLLLGCPDPDLRHPLLHQLTLNSHHHSILSDSEAPNSAHLISLLRHQRIRALCDIAMQTGRVQSLNHLHHHAGNIPVHSIAIAPLERPAGLLGLLLLVNPRAGAFHLGEHLLLSSYIQTAAQRLEADMHKLSTTAPSSKDKETSTTNTSSLAPIHTTCQNSQQKEADQLKNELISMVSHELRTPLTAIKGYAGLLQAYSVPDRLQRSESKSDTAEITPARQQQYLDIIMEQANHLEALIADLLDVSRIQAGRLALRHRNVNLAQLCQQVVQVLPLRSPDAERRSESCVGNRNKEEAQQHLDRREAAKYRIQCNLDPNLPLAWADPDRVRQVLTNLLDNAIKYSPHGGLIEVFAHAHPTPSSRPAASSASASMSQTPHSPSQEPSMMRITVRDEGIGIPQEQQAHLFQPFHRLTHPSTEHIPGTGLGLYIARKIVEAMGGNITLRSRSGHGTSVTFTLPLAPLGQPQPQPELTFVGVGVE